VLPTEALYTALATRGETAGGILRLADRMRADGVDPGIGYFAAALQRADTTPARCRILTAMRSSRVDIPSHTIVDLIARAPNFADATAVYDEMQRIGVTEVSPLFRALSDRVRHYADAQWLLEEMRLAGREAPVEVLTLAAMQAPHFAATAQAVAAVADRSGALPATIFDRWLAQARSFEEGRQVLNRAAHCGLPPSLDRLRAWLALARTLDQVRDVVDRRAGVPDPGGVAPDLFAHTPGLARTLRDVVRSTGRCAAAGAALRALRGWGATISQDLIDEAARLAHSHREVLVLGHDLQAQGVAPGARLFQIAFDHAATYPEWMLILREMADCGLRPRRPMLTVLKRAAHSADEVLAVAELWMSGGCTLLAEDLEEIEATLAGDPDAAAAWDRLRKSPIFLAEAPRDTVVGPTAASG